MGYSEITAVQRRELLTGERQNNFLTSKKILLP